METLIASNPTGRTFVFERCAREATSKYAGCARGLFFREKNACDNAPKHSVLASYLTYFTSGQLLFNIDKSNMNKEHV